MKEKLLHESNCDSQGTESKNKQALKAGSCRMACHALRMQGSPKSNGKSWKILKRNTILASKSVYGCSLRSEFSPSEFKRRLVLRLFSHKNVCEPY